MHFRKMKAYKTVHFNNIGTEKVVKTIKSPCGVGGAAAAAVVVVEGEER